MRRPASRRRRHSSRYPQAIRWPLGNPTDIARDDLPDISEAEAQQLVDDIVELLCRDFGYSRAAGARRARATARRPGDPAEDWQQLVDDILAGNELHANTRDLAAKMVRSGMDGGAIVNFLRGLMNSSAAPRDERWQAALRQSSAPGRQHAGEDRARGCCSGCANAGSGERNAASASTSAAPPRRP